MAPADRAAGSLAANRRLALARDAGLRTLDRARTTGSVEQREVVVVELAQVADVRGCCGER
jgi:hypothetical protein